MRNTVSIPTYSPETDKLRAQENHKYISPELLGIWLEDHLLQTQKDVRVSQVLQTEINTLKSDHSCYSKQGDVYFLEPKTKVAYSNDSLRESNNERIETLQAEIDSLIEALSSQNSALSNK